MEHGQTSTHCASPPFSFALSPLEPPHALQHFKRLLRPLSSSPFRKWGRVSGEKRWQWQLALKGVGSITTLSLQFASEVVGDKTTLLVRFLFVCVRTPAGTHVVRPLLVVGPLDRSHLKQLLIYRGHRSYNGFLNFKRVCRPSLMGYCTCIIAISMLLLPSIAFLSVSGNLRRLHCFHCRCYCGPARDSSCDSDKKEGSFSDVACQSLWKRKSAGNMITKEPCAFYTECIYMHTNKMTIRSNPLMLIMRCHVYTLFNKSERVVLMEVEMSVVELELELWRCSNRTELTG